MKTSPFHGWFSGRNRWIALGSMAAVGITGAMAFGANLGMLKASNSSAVGAGASQLVDSGAPGTTIVDVYVTDPAPSTPVTAATSPVTAPASAQPYAVANAGVVTVESSTSGLRLADVKAAKGFTWSVLQGSPNQLVVTLSNGVKKYQFRAITDASGAVSVKVSDVTPAPQPQQPAGGDDDDGGESDD